MLVLIYMYIAYLGVVGRKNAEGVFSIFWAARATGSASIYVISSSISVTAALATLLVFLVCGYICHVIAEIFYGNCKLKRLFKVLRNRCCPSA